MAFTRLLRELLRDPDIGSRIVPIVPDEARTFGIDALFPDVEDLRAVRAGAMSPSTPVCSSRTARPATGGY